LDDLAGQDTRFVLRSKFLRLFGGAYTLFDTAGRVVAYAQLKRFRLREDIRVFDDASRARERLSIRTQSVFDFSGAYDVIDSTSGERVGTWQRSGLKSTFMQDHWRMLDTHGVQTGELAEDNIVKALLRRAVDTLAWLLPQKYELRMQGQVVATYRQQFNPFIYKLDIDLSPSAGTAQEERLDRHMALAVAILLAAIEGRQ